MTQFFPKNPSNIENYVFKDIHPFLISSIRMFLYCTLKKSLYSFKQYHILQCFFFFK